VIPANVQISFTSPETRVIVLPDAENRTIVSLFVWTQYRNVTDGRTDRQTDRRNPSGYYSAPHCEQCRRAIKIVSVKWTLRAFVNTKGRYFEHSPIFCNWYRPKCVCIGHVPCVLLSLCVFVCAFTFSLLLRIFVCVLYVSHELNKYSLVTNRLFFSEQPSTKVSLNKMTPMLCAKIITFCWHVDLNIDIPTNCIRRIYNNMWSRFCLQYLKVYYA